MTSKHGFLEAIKHAAFEDEPTTPEKSAAPAIAPTFGSDATGTFTAAAATASVAYSPAAPIDTGTPVADNDEVYQRIFSKTDFEDTDAATTIHKFLDPLKAIADTVMPPNVKFKTAVLQAKAQAGLTEENILSAFDKMTAQLQQEENAFAQKAQQFAAREVAGRQDRIGQITNQIAQLQQELGQLSGELIEAEGKAAHAQSQFAAAAQRRSIEIQQQKAQYAALLKG
jgi:hypothetical protein